MTGLDKIIVSNRSALSKKYTETEVQMIEAAVADLVESDRAREIESRLFYLDDKAMRGFGCRPVRGPADARGNKDAIDRLYKHYSPAYIMILGAPDVVPHIKVTNLTRDEDGRIIDSDLPYACDARFHRDARRFLAPTRVVGRLPDINGGGDPRYLIGLLENATQVVRLPRTDYASWFALSARSWTGSSAITAANLFSNLDGLTLCPPTGPGKHKTLHKTRIHFSTVMGTRARMSSGVSRVRLNRLAFAAAVFPHDSCLVLSLPRSVATVRSSMRPVAANSVFPAPTCNGRPPRISAARPSPMARKKVRVTRIC